MRNYLDCEQQLNFTSGDNYISKLIVCENAYIDYTCCLAWLNVNIHTHTHTQKKETERMSLYITRWWMEKVSFFDDKYTNIYTTHMTRRNGRAMKIDSHLMSQSTDINRAILCFNGREFIENQ
jgi:hypothetical protein